MANRELKFKCGHKIHRSCNENIKDLSVKCSACYYWRYINNVNLKLKYLFYKYNICFSNGVKSNVIYKFYYINEDMVTQF